MHRIDHVPAASCTTSRHCRGATVVLDPHRLARATGLDDPDELALLAGGIREQCAIQ